MVVRTSNQYSAECMHLIITTTPVALSGRRYGGWEAYGQSKQANILFAKALADRLKTSTAGGTAGGISGSGSATAVSLHPGIIRTNLWR